MALDPPRDAIEALADADHLVAELGGTPGAITYWGVAREPWADRFIDQHNAVVKAGQGSDCAHLADGGPGVRHVAAWAPGHAFCPTCVVIDLMPMPADPAEEHTCDVCRRCRPGHVTGAILQLGTVLVLYGVCVDCRPESDPR